MEHLRMCRWNIYTSVKTSHAMGGQRREKLKVS